MNKIRNSVKALIIENNKVLFIKLEDKEGYWYLLPGGGQEPGETFIDTLKRECREELGESAKIQIYDLALIREYIGKNHEFAEYDKDLHQVEFMFRCNINNDYVPTMGAVPDNMQLGSEWIDIDDLSNHRIYPSALKDVIKKISIGQKTAVYLGDTN
ncbi:NUDIX domain-containing protein [Clostridium sp. C8-1-8]|uniref:NUDIX domain-containing protein n=1 Tax=Clostridium sp. C8-1-8 TaxID=2698831 RepID=UPI001369E48A|nr:NUDIX domain-containing protein [Clostridium sp. C8-1-8]